MMLRWFLIGVGVVSAGVGCLAEAGALASAQVAPPPVLVVATVPPEPTPLPPLVLPREEFVEQTVADATPLPDGSMPGGLAGQSPQLALAAYGVVTVSYDGQNPKNSAALVSTPHGVVMANVDQVVDGYRIIGITKAGVIFQGGVFIPVGYSQQGANPQVPPIGTATSMPAQQVPVNVNQVQPSAAPSVAPNATRVLRTPPPIRQTNVFGGQQQPMFVNSQQGLPTPAAVNVQNPLVTPTPSQ